jgi:amidase
VTDITDITKITDITDLSAEALSAAIHARQVSCRDVMQAYLARMDALNPPFNAIVSRAPHEALLAQADERDAELAPRRSAPGSRGWMHGMPQAIKDTAHALGFPTTVGSTLLAQAYPTQDSLYVARMKSAGCVVVGKTNMPEFGLGSHTYNPLFGPTGNAWDVKVSAGGSSGGAAVALVQRLLPVADGSDFMGSLRNPAGWNHVFGFRPSQGRVPAWPKPELWVAQLGTDGPMARNVRDLAALLSTQAGHDPRAPLSLSDAPRSFVPDARTTTRAAQGARIGWLGNLGGHLALEPGIAGVCESALARFTGAGAHVEDMALGFSAAQLWDAWLVWRRALVAPVVEGVMHLAGARRQVKPEALWEYDTGQDLAFLDFQQASQVRSAFYQHMCTLFERYDALALPVAQVWPFALEQTWPRQINGRAMDTYHRWMEVTTYATFAGLPAISLPAGFDATGRWPMGLQLIGKPRGDAELIALAAAYEARATALLARRPPLPPKPPPRLP